jgi:hypothetical protein
MLPKKKNNQQYPLRKAPYFVLSFFLLLWIAGVISGETERVLEQALQICLSCIGIG